MFMSEEQFITLQESRRRVPRYLFRTCSENSRGGLAANSSEQILPDDTNWRNIEFGGVAGTKRMIENHLLWRYESPSEFTSWSSSLLFAIQYALLKKDYDRKEEENIKVCVLDTSNFAIPVYPATALYDAYRITPIDRGKWPELVRHYYLSEYLLRGSIYMENVEFRVISLRDILRCGLFKLLPELEDDDWRKKNALARAVRTARQSLSSPRCLSEEREKVEISISLGKLFGHRFAFPVAVAFLSLRSWEGKTPIDPGDLDAVLERVNSYEVPKDLGGEEDFSGVAEAYRQYLPEESQRFRALAEQLLERYSEHELEKQIQNITVSTKLGTN
ncbi:uncharacterized protein K452DRAFT_312180 [Aplosporella prunicola CBS 121167]|uniref:DUF7587 domain-containing protein n=1 Tax=Aplosporella prunicola CBS 121167 TaxID=1176127 RepID=A0A6A6B2J4_9PEZI|nr:uncharacterized protein K452DRAFT_312180 [Aplosporella prunicola CBS 121167]KAF2137808.1 hypothetical protein K452DRAFT_312180 [Aplosporella prunicola CBS 121167]